MKAGDERTAPVRAKTLLIDPDTLHILWTNESVAKDCPRDIDLSAGVHIEDVIPMAGVLGVPEALKEVAETGEPVHLRKDVSTLARGSMQLAASVYRLPDGKLLLVMENTWQARGRRPGGR
jgi:hypothetical protein